MPDPRQNEATISGTVAAITPVQTVGSKNTPKQILAIVTDGRYPETIPVEFFGDKAIDSLTEAVRKGLAVGVAVSVDVFVKGREHGGKYYPSLGYRSGTLEFVERATSNAAETGPDDDLPF